MSNFKEKFFGLLAVMGALSFGVLNSSNVLGAEQQLADNGKTEYKIVLPADSSLTQRTAANELQSYFKQVTDAELPIVSSDSLDLGTELTKSGTVPQNIDCAGIEKKFQGVISQIPPVYSALKTDTVVNRAVELLSSRQQEDGGYTAFGEDEYNDGLSYETHKEDFELDPLVNEYYIRLLDLLRDEGIDVIIEQAPLNTASHEAISDEYFADYDDYIQGIAEKYPSFSVVKGVPEYDNSCFGDNNHLNRRGAERFSREIKEKWFTE